MDQFITIFEEKTWMGSFYQLLSQKKVPILSLRQKAQKLKIDRGLVISHVVYI